MAGASFRGDFAKLSRLTRGLGQLSSKAFLRQANQALAAETLSRVQDGFARGVAPDGSRWKPVLKRRRGTPPFAPLRDTGRLLNSIRPSRITAAGFYVGTPVIYAATHQWGRDAIPQRQYLPASPLPRRWAQAYAAILRAQRDEALGRR